MADDDKQTTATTTTHLEGYNITQFNGEDPTYPSSKWCQDIEDNAEIFAWTAAQKLIIARRTLCGTAALWLRSERAFKTYEELKTALTKEFPDSVNVKEMHELMASRRKRTNETFYQYMLIMKELGKRAKFPDYVAIQYIIDGIVDQEHNKAVLYGVTTYSALKDKLTIYEKMKSRVNERAAAPRQNQIVRRQAVQAEYAVRPNQFQKRCYNCGEINHVAGECKNGLKCFGCNQFGHIRQNCKVNPVHTGAGGENAAYRRYGNGGVNFKMEDNRRTQLSGQGGGGVGHRAGTSGFGWRSAMFGVKSRTHGESEVGNIGNENERNYSHEIPDQKTQPEKSENVTDVNDVNFEVMHSVNKQYSHIIKPVKSVLLNKFSVRALIDSGSDCNLMSESVYNQVRGDITNEELIMTGLGECLVRSRGTVKIDMFVDNQIYNDVVFHLVPNAVMPYDVIIGQEFLNGVTMIMNGGVVLFRNDNWIGKIDCFTGNTDVDVAHVQDADIRNKAIQCVQDYKPVKKEEAPIQLKIILKDDIPVSQRPRRLSLMEQQVVEGQVDEWLRNGIIRVSHSEYSSPLVLVKKKDGSTRVCVDYRLLNRKIAKDEFPLPIIDDLIDKLKGAKVFSVLDFKNGFFHLKVSEESVRYTSFVTHHGQFEFLRVPFGLSICPKTFMRYVTIIFRELIAKGVMMIFIDDIIIPAADEVQAIERLKQVLDVASRHGLQINWKKVKLLQREVEYLGHRVKDGEVRPSTEKVDAVNRYPEPKNIKQLHSFIGLTSYFRKYVEGYAMIAKPLTNMLKKGAEFAFNIEHKAAFEELKHKLVSGPVLKIFDSNLRTELHTDASSQGLAAILMQYHPGSGLHPVHYMSRSTNETQSRYSSYELEALAIVEGVRKFRHYLYGVHFKIITDCKAFEMTLKKKELTAKVARWVMMLDEYDFEVEHRSGTRMKHVDALSRMPRVAVLTLNDGLKLAQDKDDGLKAIKEILKGSHYEDYWIENGILYKGIEKKIVVPRSLEREIIKKIHSNGHFGKLKMKELLSRDYYIRNLDKKIEEFIVTCIPCLLSMRKEGKQEGFLHPIEKESIPFDTLHLDHIGPLTETRKQYNYILTIIDAFTKFVWLFPVKTTSSHETINKLQLHQNIFGNPRRVITDRGTAFTSNEFKEYCEEEKISHVKITTGVPRGNGQVERVHRIIIPVLTKLSVESPGVWYRHVGRVQRALNGTFQRSIGTTPFELLTGTKMRNKEDLQILQLLQDEAILHYDENRENLRLQAREQILKIQDENRKTYNKKRKESTTYNEGDLVLIKRTQFGPGLKLKIKFLGPYKVTKCKGKDRYDVERVDSSSEGPARTSSSADQMKRWPGYDRESLD